MCVKLPSVSEWGGIALTDGLAVNTGRIYCYTGVTVRYANRTKRRTKRGEIAKETKKTKTLTDERNDSRWHQRATKSHHGRDRNTSAHAVFGCSSCSCFPPLFVLPLRTSPASLVLSFSLHPSSSRAPLSPGLARLARIPSRSALQRIWHREVIVCERWFSSPLSLRRALMQTTVSPSHHPNPTVNAAKLTGTNSLWHAVARLFRRVCLLLRERWISGD